MNILRDRRQISILILSKFKSFMTEAVMRNKSMGWFLYDNELRHERVKRIN